MPRRSAAFSAAFALAILASTGASGQAGDLDELRDTAAAEAGSHVFFDADSFGINKDGARKTFDGNFVAIAAGTLFAADHASVDGKTGLIEADGHVVVMSQSAIFTGERVRYFTDTGDFKIDKAQMTVNDAAQAEAITRQILGLTPKEAEFEAKRKLRLAEIEDRKARLRNEARRQARVGGEPGEVDEDVDEGLVQRYARLLDQSELTAKQPNPSLSRIPPARLETTLKRRKFFDENRGKSGVLPAMKAPEALYFKVRGDEITRTDGNDFRAREGLFTPCVCADDEAPAWGFRSSEMFAQVGGYADLYHPILEIKGIPVLYLPYLKIPLKSARQSGFLMPTISYERRSGSIVSQPVFFDLGKDADATLTTDVFENRGTRLGLEYRTQQREYSGWEFNAEAIRDHLWLEDRGKRQQFLPRYQQGLENAHKGAAGAVPGSVDDPAYWKGAGYDMTTGDPDKTEAAYARAKADLPSQLAVPSNTWRGAYQWRGSTFLAPRLSLVSNAEVVSDHRYLGELRVPNDFQEALFGGRQATTYADTKMQLNLDGTDLYAGAGFRYGDDHRLAERFEGDQMPLRFKLLSREVSLLGPNALVPVYAEASAEQIRVSEFGSGLPPGQTSLGDGYWRRLRLRTVAPLVSDSIVQVSQFTESEARYIEHDGLTTPRSEMRSFRTGVDFTLPIDGKGELPKWLESTDPVCVAGAPEFSEAACERLTSDPNRPVAWGQHVMDWRLRFSLRPSVVKRGPYTTLNTDGKPLAYFGSDVPAPAGDPNSDPNTPDAERMKPHQIVELSTNHVWRLFRRGWTLKKAEEAPELKPAATPAAPETLEERARRELLLSLDRPLTPESQLQDALNRKWLVDRYALEDKVYDTPATFHASVAYDAIDARQRGEVRKANQQALAAGLAPGQKLAALPEGWKDLYTSASFSHAGFTTAAALQYAIYVRRIRQEKYSLIFPAVAQSVLELGYVRSYEFTPELNKSSLTKTRIVNLSSSLIPSVITYIRLKKQDVQDVPSSYEHDVYSAVGFTFNSSAQCWGLNFAREKAFSTDERDASYVLQLNVVFMGQQRPLPSMDKGVVRDVRSTQ